MALPRIQYIDAGPALQKASVSAATAPGRALASVGGAIEDEGQRWMRIQGEVRQNKEAGDRSAFMLQRDKDAASFQNDLLKRADYDDWDDDFQSRVEGWRGDIDALNLSPEGKRILTEQYNAWAGQQYVNVSRTAALKSVNEGRARVGMALEDSARVGDRDGIARNLDELRRLGLPPSDIEKAKRETERTIVSSDVNRQITEDPSGWPDRLKDPQFQKDYPDMTDADINRSLRMAEGLNEENRKKESDDLELKAARGEIQESDIDNSKFLTDLDREKWKQNLKDTSPPDPESYTNAWTVLGALRQHRDDPSVDNIQYMQAFNETRSTVLGMVPLNSQGDLKRELNYLSPAGRDVDQPRKTSILSKEDYNAMARDQATRAREAGQFGNIGDDATKEEKEKAYRKWEDVRANSQLFIGGLDTSDPNKARKEIREFVDSQIAGPLQKTTAKDLKTSVPGSGQSMNLRKPLTGKSLIPFGQAPKEPDGVLPPKDSDPNSELDAALKVLDDNGIPRPQPPDYNR